MLWYERHTIFLVQPFNRSAPERDVGNWKWGRGQNLPKLPTNTTKKTGQKLDLMHPCAKAACVVKLDNVKTHVKIAWINAHCKKIGPRYLSLRALPKLYIPSTIKIWKKVLTKAILADKTGLVSSRLACTSSKTDVLSKIETKFNPEFSINVKCFLT